MQATTASKTADAVAAARATGDWDARPIFRDPLAIELTSSAWRTALVFAPFRALVTRSYEWALGGLLGLVQARSRYTEERLLASGARQYVLLGAGFDSFALRSRSGPPDCAVRVFELDHPATQRVKRERIAQAGIELPEHLRFVPIDFERERIKDGLDRGGFNAKEPALFAWLGVVPYLSNDAIDAVWKSVVWHAARAELTTQPAGIRLAVDGVRLANEIKSENPLGSIVLHAAAAWSARYWLEEEAHHEVAYGMLLEMMGDEPIPQEEVVEHRGFFPEDNYARVCMLQACVEIEAAVTYGEMAKKAHDPLVRDVFLNIVRDEVQHRQYFTSFAQALVDAEVYPAKDVLAMAFTWIRPNGETRGSKRKQQTSREGFVNWWERVRSDESDDLALHEEQIHSAYLKSKKERSVLNHVRVALACRLVDGIVSTINHAIETREAAAE